MYLNQTFGEGTALAASIDPASQAAGTVLTSWVSTAEFHQFGALISTGVLGTSATVDAKIRQATDSSGTGAKDVTGKAITQIVKASGDNKQAIINFDTDDLDTNGGFNYVAVSVTVGTAASIVAAYLFGRPRFETAATFNQTGVVQVV